MKRILRRDWRVPSQTHVNVERRTISGKHRLCLLTRLAVHCDLGIASAKSIGIIVWVIPTDEELMIAQHTLALVRPHAGLTEGAPS
jgi:hypothetical protein